MILSLMYHPLAKLRHLNLSLAIFWSSYLALWPGVLFWGFRI